MAEYKEKLLKEFHDAPLKVGDPVLVKSKFFEGYPRNPEKKESCKITKIEGDKITVERGETYRNTAVVTADNIVKSDHSIGHNPFPDGAYWRRRVHVINFGLASIMSKIFPEHRAISEFKEWKVNGIPVKETNFNPYVTDKDGNRRYFQRDFCWTLEQKQALIDSIFNGLNCGQILVRTHDYKWLEAEMKNGNTEACFSDIVDGKQRLNAVNEYMNDKFPDSKGYYYSDLSERAQWEFEDSMCFSYAEMDIDTRDEDVIAAFLAVNFTGVPQSREHIEYVEHIASIMK